MREDFGCARIFGVCTLDLVCDEWFVGALPILGMSEVKDNMCTASENIVGVRENILGVRTFCVCPLDLVCDE